MEKKSLNMEEMEKELRECYITFLNINTEEKAVSYDEILYINDKLYKIFLFSTSVNMIFYFLRNGKDKAYIEMENMLKSIKESLEKAIEFSDKFKTD